MKETKSFKKKINENRGKIWVETRVCNEVFYTISCKKKSSTQEKLLKGGGSLKLPDHTDLSVKLASSRVCLELHTWIAHCFTHAPRVAGSNPENFKSIRFGCKLDAVTTGHWNSTNDLVLGTMVLRTYQYYTTRTHSLSTALHFHSKPVTELDLCKIVKALNGMR